MRVLSIGNFGTGWDGSICDEEHIAKALEELGHEVFRVQRETRPEQYPDVDFTLIAQWDGYGDLSHLPEPLVYWAFDYQADGQEWHERLVKEANLYLSKRIADSKYPNWQYLSQDFAPNFLQPYARVTKDIDVLFTGSYLDWAKERNETIRAINDKFNLVIYSVNAWPSEWNLDVRPPVMDEGLPELYARAKVILSIDHTLEAGYWSDRVAQALCCKALVLHRYQPLCETAFKNKVAYFYNIEGCLEYIENLLGMPEEDANLVRQVGYEYADEFLRVKNRVEDLLTIVGKL